MGTDSSDGGIAEQLSRLAKLRADGALSEEEFTISKQKLLASFDTENKPTGASGSQNANRDVINERSLKNQNIALRFQNLLHNNGAWVFGALAIVAVGLAVFLNLKNTLVSNGIETARQNVTSSRYSEWCSDDDVLNVVKKLFWNNSEYGRNVMAGQNFAVFGSAFQVTKLGDLMVLIRSGRYKQFVSEAVDNMDQRTLGGTTRDDMKKLGVQLFEKIPPILDVMYPLFSFDNRGLVEGFDPNIQKVSCRLKVTKDMAYAAKKLAPTAQIAELYSMTDSLGRRTGENESWIRYTVRPDRDGYDVSVQSFPF